MVLLYAMQVKRWKLDAAATYLLSQRKAGPPGDHFKCLLAAAERHIFDDMSSGLWREIGPCPGYDAQVRCLVDVLKVGDDITLRGNLPVTSVLPPKGIANIRNSCFVASALQLLAAAPSVYERLVLREEWDTAEDDGMFAALGRRRVILTGAVTILYTSCSTLA